MNEYRAAYQSLKSPAEVTDCALGLTPIPIVGWISPASWYGFPPALVPIASNGSGPNYLGVWKHWFSERNPSYVMMYVDSGRMVVEIARTAGQFFCYLAMTALSVDDGIGPLLEQWAARVGIRNLPELDSVSLKTGDDPKGFSSLPQFQADPPLNSVLDAGVYTGDFPIGRYSDRRQRWKNACSFELPQEFVASWPDHITLPRWLSSENKEEVFYDMVATGDLRAAWLTLNSTGWKIERAKSALRDLVRLANNPHLETVAEAWCTIASSSAGGY
jgi:hypothetical protein